MCHIVGITYRQLDYWARTGLAQPDVVARGSGTWRRYSGNDVAELLVIRRLLDAGMNLNRLRIVMDTLRTVPSDLLDDILEVMAEGHGVIGVAVGPIIAEVNEHIAALTT